MADRDVTVGVKASTADYDANILRSAALTKKFASEGLAAGRSLDTVGRTAGRAGLVAAAGLGLIVGATARFDKAMSAVQAATHETTDNMELLRQAAIKAGADTAFSASEAAAGIEELAKAGVSTADILGGGLRGALNLAAAGTISVGDAAEFTATALTQFKLNGDQATHVADLLAAGAGKAQGGVSDMALALNYAGVPAANLGATIEETAGTIALFASNGIIGQKAGTGLRGMLSSLSSPSVEAQKTMDALGISIFDTSGKFIGMAGLADELQSSMAGLTDKERANALGRIFGNAQLQTANILFRDGAAGVEEWTNNVDDAGYAQETAALKLDNLAGDLEKFRGSLETAMISAGEGSQGPLRKLVQGATGVVNAFSKAPAPIQSTATSLLAIAAATGGGVWLGSRIIRSISDTKNALDNLSESSTKGSKALRGIALAGAGLAGLTIGAAAIRSIQEATDESLPGVETLTARLIALKDAKVGDLGAEFDSLGASLDRIAASEDVFNGIGQINTTGLSDALQKPFEGLFGEAGSLRQAKAEVGDLDDALANLATTGGVAAAQQAFAQLAKSQGLSKEQTNQLRDSLPAYTDALAGAANSAQVADGATKDLTKSTYKLGDGTEVTASQIEKIKDAFHKEVEAARNVAKQFVSLGDSLDDSKVSLDKWIKQLAQQADALRNFRLNAEEAGKKGLRDGLIKELEAAGPAGALRMKQLANATKDQIARANEAWKSGQGEIRKYIQATTDVPKELKTKFTVDNAQAMQHVRDVSAALHGLNDKTIYVTTVLRTIHQESRLNGHASGGFISGPGTSTSDSIPARLSRGEYVMSAKAVDKYGVAMMDGLNARRFADGGSTGGGDTAGSPLLAKIIAAMLGGGFGPGQLRAFQKDLDDVQRALRKNKGKWTDEIRSQARDLFKEIREAEKERARAIREAFRSLETDLADGAAGIRAELHDLKQSLRDAGGVWNKAMEQHAARIVALSHRYDAQAAQLAAQQGVLADLVATGEQLASAQASLFSQVAGNFSSDLFGNGLAGFFSTAAKDTQQSSMFQDVLQQLSAMGLDGPAFEALAASGDVKTAIQLLNSGAIDSFESAYAARSNALTSLGQFAGDTVFGQQIADNTAQIAAQNTLIQTTQATMDKLQAAVDRQEAVLRDLAGLPRHIRDSTHDGAYWGTKEGIAAVASSAGQRVAMSGGQRA
jgi:TP901 family phage tail tape measure protein